MRAHACSLAGCREPVVGRKLCRKHYQRAWKAGEFANQPLPPRVAGKTLCPAEHKHAESSTCYIQHQCRCVPCKVKHTAMETGRKKQKAYGRFDTGLVDAEPVREHMMMLAEFGLGYKRVAAIAGIGITPTRNLIWGRQDPGPRYGELQKRVKRETADALLSVQPVLENLAGGASVPARATVRRIQSLIAFGWSQSKIADRLGMLDTNLSTVRLRYQRAAARGRGAHVMVSARTARAVARLYNELSVTLAPHEEWRDKIAFSRARHMGAENGWPLPMDWEAFDNEFDRSQPVRRSVA